MIKKSHNFVDFQCITFGQRARGGDSNNPKIADVICVHAVWGIRDGLTRDDLEISLILGNFKGYMLLKTSKNLILLR